MGERLLFGNTSFSRIGQAFSSSWNGKPSGIINGFNSLAGSNGGLSDSDITAIEAYNDQIDACVGSQTAFYNTMLNTSEAAQDLVASANGGKVSINALSGAMKNAGKTSFAMRAGVTALNVATAMLATYAVQGAVKGLDYLANRNVYQAREYQNQYNESKKLATQSNDELTSLDSLIDRYKTLSETSESSFQTRQSMVGIQNEISSMLGDQAGSIDLLNGSLDVQLAKLQELRVAYEEAAIEAQYLALYNAKNVSDNVTPNESYLWMQDRYAHKGSYDKDVYEALRNHGYGFNVQANRFPSQLLIDDSFDPTTGNKVKDAQSRIDILSGMADALETEGLKSTDAYADIIQQRADYSAKLSQTEKEAHQYAQLLAKHYQNADTDLSNMLVNDADSFEAYRDRLMDLVSNDDMFIPYIESGIIDTSGLSKDVDSVIAMDERLSAGYDAFLKKQAEVKRRQSEDSLFDFFDDPSKSAAENRKAQEDLIDWMDSLSDSELEVAVDIVLNDSNANLTLDGLKDKVAEAVAPPQETPSTYTDFVNNQVEAFTQKLAKYQEMQEAVTKLLSGESTVDSLILEHPEWAKYKNDMVNGLKGAAQDVRNSVSEELSNVSITEDDQASFDAWRDAFMKQFDQSPITLPVNIEAETSGMDNVLNAIKSSVSGTGLAADTVKTLTDRYKELGDVNAAGLFEYTANGIHLNTDALRNLESAYEAQKKLDISNQLSKLQKDYASLTDQINKSTDATEKMGLEQQRQKLGDQINQMKGLQAQYDGLTSKYNKWQQAQSMGEEGDMYDSVVSGLKDVKELYDEGLIGTNKFRAAVDMMTFEDMSTATPKELAAAYEKAYPVMQKYFTDGHKGLERFLKDVETKGKEAGQDWAHQLDNGEWEFNFDDNAVAEALGISVEAVQMALRKLSDYGFDVKLDMGVQDLDTIQQKAETAASSLQNMGATDYKFNFDATNIDRINEQIEVAQQTLDQFRNTDGTVNIEAQGAQEAQYVLATLIMQKQQIEQPAIMKVDAGNAPGEMGEAVRMLQDFQTASNTLEVQTAIGADTSQAQAAVDALASQIAGLSPEVLATLGFTGDVTPESIASVIQGISPEVLCQLVPEVQPVEQAETTVPGKVEWENEPPDVSGLEITAPGKIEWEVQAPEVGGITVTVPGKVEWETQSPETGGMEVVAPGRIEWDIQAPDVSGIEPVVTGKVNWENENTPDQSSENQKGGNAGKGHIEDNSNGMITFFSEEQTVDVEPRVSDPGKVVQDIQTVADSSPVAWEIEWGDSSGQVVENVQNAIDSSPVELKFSDRSNAGDAVFQSIGAVPDMLDSGNVQAVNDLNAAYQAFCEADRNNAAQLQSTAKNFIDAYDEVSNRITESGGVMPELDSTVQESMDRIRDLASSGETVTVDAEVSDPSKPVEEIQESAEGATVEVDVEANTDDVSTDGVSADPINVPVEPEMQDTGDLTVQVKAEVEDADLSGVEDKDATVTFDVDSSAPDSYSPSEKSSTASYSVDSSAVDGWTPPTKHGTVVYSASGGGAATGTAYAKGTAYESGDWAVRNNGVALGGELGKELIVRDGKFFTIGNDGAEFFRYKSGDIIFNASQTRELLESGKIISARKRGKVFGDNSAYAAGTAFSSGSGGFYTGKVSSSSSSTKKKTSSGSSSSSKSSGSSSSTSSSGNSFGNETKKKGTEIVDWIEIAIDRIEQLVDNLAATAESTFKILSTRMEASASEIKTIIDEVNLQKQAYDRYIQEANAVALEGDIKQLVRDGTIDISKYDKKTKELIDEYQEWYEKALDCANAVDELNERLSELYEERFEAIQDDFDNQLSLLDHMTDSYESALKKIEKSGYMGGQELYKSLIDVERQNIAVQTTELEKLEEALSDALYKGRIEKYSESWYEMQEDINDCKESIQDSEIEILSLQKSLRELSWDSFDYIQDRISDITTETEFLINLLDSSKLFDDNGKMTNTGIAQLGLRALNYNVYMEQAAQYADEIKKINADIAKDPNNTKLIERRTELLKLQQDSIKSAEDEKRAVADLVEEGINIELDALKNLIDSYEDSIESAKDLYDYQKKIGDQSKKIASLQKQIAAYQGDTSEENRARLQKLQVDLSDALETLEETQYDQYIKDQKKLLDDLYDDYEEMLNSRLDDIDALMNEMIDIANANAVDIAQTIADECKAVGYTISQNMSDIWSGKSSDNILKKYGDDIVSQLTTLNTVISSIVSNVGIISGAGDAIASSTISTTKPTTDPVAPADYAPEPEPTVEEKKQVEIAKNTKAYTIDSKGALKSSDSLKKNSVYDVVGEETIKKKKYIKVIVGGQERLIEDNKNINKIGFSQGGFVADLQRVAYQNGDNIVSFNSLTRGEAILTPEQTVQFKNLINSLPQLQGIVDMSSQLSSLSSAGNSSVGNVNYNFGGINIPIERVLDYNDFVRQLRQDDKFEKMIQSMTIERINGGSQLAKHKYNW